MPRPGDRRRRWLSELQDRALQAALVREQRALLLRFAEHLNRTAWESKTDETLVDEFLEAQHG